VCAGAVWSGLLEAQLMDRIINGEQVTDAEATSNDDRQQLFGLVQFGLYIAAAVVFIRWLYGAYQNVSVVAPAEKRYGIGWAIGSWFVPIMNLFRPKQMVNDIGRAGGRDAADAQPGALLLGWWLLWVLSSFIVNFAARSYMRADTAEEIKTGTILYLVSDAMSVVCAILAIVIVRKGTDRLDAKAAAVPPPPPAPESDFRVPERPAVAPA
jgi:heme/copper-type cytochrome/quinol oxidase subunit 3